MADSSRLTSRPTSGSIRPGVSSRFPRSRTTSTRRTTSSTIRRMPALRALPTRSAPVATIVCPVTPPGHQPRRSDQPCSSLASGHPDSKWGGAITAGLQLKNLPTGVGDTLNVDATFAKGDTKAVISTSGASPSFAMFRGTGTNNPSVGFGYVSDGVLRQWQLPEREPLGHQRHPVDQLPSDSAAATSTTGMRTGRAACSAAHRSCVTTARQPLRIATRSPATRCSAGVTVVRIRPRPAIRTSTCIRLASAPDGRLSRV